MNIKTENPSYKYPNKISKPYILTKYLNRNSSKYLN